MVAEMETMGGHAVARETSVWTALPERVAAQIADEKNHKYVVSVAQDPELVQGFAEANRFTLGGAFEPADMLHIGAVYVYPDFRGCGIGQKLIHHVIEWGRKAGCTCCELNVLSGNPAKRLYEKIGFADLQTLMIRDLS